METGKPASRHWTQQQLLSSTLASYICGGNPAPARIIAQHRTQETTESADAAGQTSCGMPVLLEHGGPRRDE